MRADHGSISLEHNRIKQFETQPFRPMVQGPLGQIQPFHPGLLAKRRRAFCCRSPSPSDKDCCWDNAVVENFFSTRKHELGLDDDAAMLNSPQQLIRHLAFKIDGYDNHERRHATIVYLSPIDDETKPINTRRLPRVEP